MKHGANSPLFDNLFGEIMTLKQQDLIAMPILNGLGGNKMKSFKKGTMQGEIRIVYIEKYRYTKTKGPYYYFSPRLELVSKDGCWLTNYGFRTNAFRKMEKQLINDGWQIVPTEEI